MALSSADLKEKGNSAFQAGDFEEARRWFSEGIAVDGRNHVLYSNRSAAHAGLGQYTEALVGPSPFPSEVRKPTAAL
jgi:stress-induced-phosphoprotein 1